MSDFDKILAYRNISPYLSKEECEIIASRLGFSQETIEKRLVGKNKEDEFKLILLLTDSCKSVEEFEEGLSQLYEKATPDLQVTLKDGTRFMLEIKHTDKDVYSISNGNLNRRIDFAHEHNLTLYFAISIKGFWMLFDEHYLQEKRGKINLSDFLNSKLDDLLGCVSYIFPKEIRIRSVYSKISSKHLGLQFEPYGNLVSYELYYESKKIFRVKGKNSPYYEFIVLLSALQDRLSMDSHIVTRDGDYTVIIDQFKENFQTIPEYKFLLAPIEHMVNENLEKQDAHSFIKQAISNPKAYNYKEQLKYIRATMRFLANCGINIMYIKDHNIYSIEH